MDARVDFSTALDQISSPPTPLASFYRAIPNCRLPQRADRSAAGTMPTRAFRYCEALTSASAFGWYLFPPISFSLMWDGGCDVLWTYQSADAWFPLRVAQFPNFADHFDRVAPPGFKGFSPPFVAAFKEPGVVQIWSGLFARTAPDWSLLVRAPANLAHSQGYDHYEGIVETDRWFGPLFANLRLTRTDQPVHFSADFPLAQVQALPRFVYAEDTIGAVQRVEAPAQLTKADWDNYERTIVVPNQDRDRPFGAYAVAGRKRRKGDSCPFAAGAYAGEAD